MTELQTFLESNQLMTGALGVSVLAYVWLWVKALPRSLKQLYEKFLTTTLEINQTCKSYSFVIEFVTKECVKPKQIRKFTLNLLDSESSRFGNPGGNRRKHLTKTPSGTQWFWYKRRLVVFNRSQVHTEHGNYIDTASFVFFTRKQSIVDDFLKACERLDTRKSLVEVLTFCNSSMGIGGHLSCFKSRQLETVILNGDQKREIVEDMSRFMRSSAFYGKRGIPYKRNYLLQGPPGTGKSSLILGLATNFGLDVCNAKLAKLGDLMSYLEDHSSGMGHTLIVFEDVDRQVEETQTKIQRLTNRATEEENSAVGSVTEDTADSLKDRLSKFINFLDGLDTPYGSIIILTVNNPENLPNVVKRPGRIDACYTLDYLQEEAAAEMCELFGFTLDQMWDSIGSFPVQPALLQELLLQKALSRNF